MTNRLPAGLGKLLARDGEAPRWAGFALWSMGVVLAITAQRALPADAHRGALLFLAAAVACVAGIRLVDETAKEGVAAADVGASLAKPDRRRAGRAGGLIALGLIGSLLTVASAAENAAVAATLASWIASIVLVVLGAAVGVRKPVSAWRPRITHAQAMHGVLLLGIVGLAIALRLPHLAAIPPDVHADEASVGLDARSLLHGDWADLFGLGFMQMPELSYGIAASFMRLFGDDLYGLRMASVFLGVLSVVLLYFVGRRLYGPRTALIASFVLAVAQWHIQFSRSGLNNMQAVPATLLVVLCLLRAFQSRRELDFVFAGLSLGVCAVVYYGGRAAFAIAGVYLPYRLLRDRVSWRDAAVAVLCITAGVWVFLAPTAVTFARSPGQALQAHAHAVWLFAPSNLDHERRAYRESSTVRIVQTQVERTIEAVNRTGETSEQYGRPGKPLFDVWSAALVVPGAAYILFRIRRSSHLLLVLLLVVPLLAGALTVDALFSPRVLIALPALALLPALVLDAGYRTAERWLGRAGRYGLAALIVGFGALALHANYHDYFEQQVKTLRVAGYYTTISSYVLEVGVRNRVFVISDPRVHPYPDPTTRFLLPHSEAVALGLSLGSVVHVPSGKGAAFVVDYSPETARLLRSIVRRYPNGVESVHRDALGALLFTSYEVAPEGLARSATGSPG